MFPPSSIARIPVRLMLLAVVIGIAYRIQAQSPALTQVPASTLEMPRDTADLTYYGLNNKMLVYGFYSGRKFKTAWLEGNNRSILADSLITLIGNLRYEGLLPINYHLRELRIQLQDAGNPAVLLRIDALLTDAWLSLQHDLLKGRTAVRDRGDTTGYATLRSLPVLGLRKSIRTHEPHHSGYHMLKQALALSLDSLQGERKLELLEGTADMNAPYNKTIAQIEINIERWRNERQSFTSRYLIVNIPSFLLRIISHDSILFTARVIVGTTDHQTPVLSSKIDCLVTYPYWHVPRKIAVEEYLPILQKDTSFLSRNQFDVLNKRGKLLDPAKIDWNQFNESNFPVMLRQREGPDNSLGILKFVFDNPYAVFLHDTNNKRLFRKDIRAFSHGCIRTEKAVALAHYFLTGDFKKNSETLSNYLSLQERHSLDLPTPLSIYVKYFTCEYTGKRLVMYRDVYDLDKVIFDGLYK